MKAKLQIRDIIKATGLDRETLRFYENRGLLPKPSRSQAGYRQFSPEVITRLKFIKLAQEVGFSLKEISELLNLGGAKTLTRQDLRRVAHTKIMGIEEKIKSLKQMKEVLLDFSSRSLKECKTSDCPILAEFNLLEG